MDVLQSSHDEAPPFLPNEIICKILSHRTELIQREKQAKEDAATAFWVPVIHELINTFWSMSPPKEPQVLLTQWHRIYNLQRLGMCTFRYIAVRKDTHSAIQCMNKWYPLPKGWFCAPYKRLWCVPCICCFSRRLCSVSRAKVLARQRKPYICAACAVCRLKNKLGHH